MPSISNPLPYSTPPPSRPLVSFASRSSSVKWRCGDSKVFTKAVEVEDRAAESPQEVKYVIWLRCGRPCDSSTPENGDEAGSRRIVILDPITQGRGPRWPLPTTSVRVASKKGYIWIRLERLMRTANEISCTTNAALIIMLSGAAVTHNCMRRRCWFCFHNAWGMTSAGEYKLPTTTKK